MPITEEEIVPGAVAYLSLESLRTSGELKQPALQSNVRTGPFVCIAVKDNSCAWLEITSRVENRPERIALQTAWKREGGNRWLTDDQYINDARTPFIGPKRIFAAASKDEHVYNHFLRPQVTDVGVQALLKEVKTLGGVVE
jgi:hypothetical protein